ncbi:MAG TPA: DUF1214 domain-containing protein [Nocardioidaceae bacterium]|nr:DUF1214 domain-containing protein [Nocardioidaceae bacterium]
MAIKVTGDNFVRAETDRMFADLQRDAGGVNRFNHNREPADIAHQTVIRLNRDTLYSFAIVDISAGATVTVPDADGRYVSVMIVNNDHYINDVFHDAGVYDLTVERFDTPYVAVAARTLVDPADPDDIAEVVRLQDQFAVEAASATPFTSPDYDKPSFDAARGALLTLARAGIESGRMFGRKDEVDPIRHLMGTAAGWGGLPTTEAYYAGVEGGRSADGAYALTVEDVPVDAFWSISVYNADGYFEPNDLNAYSVNDITGSKNADGSVTVTFGGTASDPNPLPITEGWNYLVRMYRPRPEILDGSWTFPALPSE